MRLAGPHAVSRHGEERMKRHVKLAGFAFAASVLWSSQSPAQDDTTVALLDPRAYGVSADDLETFAEIFVDVEKISIRYEMELARAESEQEARLLRARRARETREQIERRGWSEAKYEEVNDIVDREPALLTRVLALIEERP